MVGSVAANSFRSVCFARDNVSPAARVERHANGTLVCFCLLSTSVLVNVECWPATGASVRSIKRSNAGNPNGTASASRRPWLSHSEILGQRRRHYRSLALCEQQDRPIPQSLTSSTLANTVVPLHTPSEDRHKTVNTLI